MKINKKALHFSIFFLSLVLIGGTMIACAQEHPEHPQEHPKEHPSKEHPSEHPAEHPAEHPSEHPQAKKQELTKEALAEAIENYINEESTKTEGYYLFNDPKERKDLYLKLDRVHKERLSRLSADIYFACADFKEKGGTMYDLDFFMKGTSTDDLTFDEVYLHKESGKERYVWVEKDGFWQRQMP
jgi:hypothetical protein